MNVTGISGFLVRLSADDNRSALATVAVGVAGARFELEPLFAVTERSGDDATLSPATRRGGGRWHLARPVGQADSVHAWDVAHAMTRASGLGVGGPVFVEPDFVQEWPYENPLDRGAAIGAAPGDACTFNDQVGALPHVPGVFAWHLGETQTQLRRARALASPVSSRIRIAHLDTGYDPAHATFPRRFPNQVRTDLQRNFAKDQASNDAHDPFARGVLKNPGHGTGTLSILAGNQFAFTGQGYRFDESLGGAPDAEIVPVRVGTSVVQLHTSHIAQGIAYAAGLCADEQTRIHVLSMSMGGVASVAWADAVNMAYDAGIVFVAAAGNNFSIAGTGFPTHLIVYPARFRRVIAACGVMADRRPYYGLSAGTMQGNWGPVSKMATALAAFTPNISWAEINCSAVVDMEGSGTSAATPQIAAAAALYYQKHAAPLFDRTRYPEPWMRVEAVRHALFSQADRSADGGRAEKLGNGIVQAASALSVQPVDAATLQKAAADSAILPLLRVLTGFGVGPSPTTDAMLALEATQLTQRWTREDAQNAFELAVPDPDLPADAIPRAQLQRFLDALVEHPQASEALKGRARQTSEALFPRGVVVPPSRPPAPPDHPAGSSLGSAPDTSDLKPGVTNARPFVPPRPAFRALRTFSIDPSLTTQLETAPISEITIKAPWEALAPGPIGEYLEVLDVDPASDAFYEPVDLDHPSVLAQDGLPPSEGTPQFHQQMVYAVASVTISHFERALGRKALWRPGPPPAGADDRTDSMFVRRLRVYPHALREQNAFYSPQKIALLFGYFPATDDDPGDHVPGGMVFTCLSHDIVAHETTHALLDGMHRKFLNATNRDVRAFHEGFADIVALLQHFTLRDVLHHEIARTRGALRTNENLLGQLAGQFGRSSGMRGALRDAIGKIDPTTGEWAPHLPDPAEFEQLTEAHARGALLVAAVFDAFLAIYGTRTADLLRLASEGSGVLRPGALHPDLLGRLADEAAKTAQHVLTMCIRALDYCPPVDITFGEFLRAVMTADTDAVPDDDMGYRVAFVEAFRRRGIYPRDLRTLSPDSLLWRTPASDELTPSRALEDGLQRLQSYVRDFLFAESHPNGAAPRERVFFLQRTVRRDLHAWLREHFRTHANGATDAAFLGLDPTQSFEVHTARFALRPSPDNEIDAVFLLGVLQRTVLPADPSTPGVGKMTFEGGSTIVADLRRLRIRYCVRKSISSTSRRQRQRAFAAQELEAPRMTYFGGNDALEPFAAMHRGMER